MVWTESCFVQSLQRRAFLLPPGLAGSCPAPRGYQFLFSQLWQDLSTKQLEGEGFILAHMSTGNSIMVGSGWQQKFWSRDICSQEVESEQEVEVGYKTSRPFPRWPTSSSKVLLPEGSATFPNVSSFGDQWCSTAWAVGGTVHMPVTVVGFWPHDSHIYICLQVFSWLCFCLPFAFQSLNNIGHYVLCWSSPVALQLFDLIPSTKTPFFSSKEGTICFWWLSLWERMQFTTVVLCRSYAVQDPSPQNCAGHSHLVC